MARLSGRQAYTKQRDLPLPVPAAVLFSSLTCLHASISAQNLARHTPMLFPLRAPEGGGGWNFLNVALLMGMHGLSSEVLLLSGAGLWRAPASPCRPVGKESVTFGYELLWENRTTQKPSGHQERCFSLLAKLILFSSYLVSSKEYRISLILLLCDSGSSFECLGINWIKWKFKCFADRYNRSRPAVCKLLWEKHNSVDLLSADLPIAFCLCRLSYHAYAPAH